MTIIKYKDEDGWMTYQDMIGIKISIRKMRLEEEEFNKFERYVNEFNQIFQPNITDLLGINSKYELGQI